MNYENVLMLNNIRQFRILEEEGLDVLIAKMNSFSGIVKKACSQFITADMVIDRIYFGSEFCDCLIPSMNDIQAVIAYCKELNYRFSMVLPYITDSKLDVVNDVLKYLDGLDESIEVICNDWGLVYLINQKYNHLHIVLGRLLDKMSKDARLTNEEYVQLYNENSLAYLKTSNLYASSYIELLAENHIKRIELDCPPQGLQLSNETMDSKISVSLYVPFGFLTTGRMCMMRFLGQDGTEKYSLETKCKHKCQQYNQVMKKMKNCQFDVNGEFVFKNLEFYRKGNTIFYLADNCEEVLASNQQIDRLILQVGIPV